MIYKKLVNPITLVCQTKIILSIKEYFLIPQIAPLIWLILFFSFIMIFLLFNILNYFNFLINKVKTNLQNSKNIPNSSIIWKW